MSVLVEVVACTADDAVRAAEAGADRIELVCAISEGGLTPSLGTLLEIKARCRLPVMAMVRPRGGGFVYSEAEFATMLRDAEALLAAGADGLVTGLIDRGKVDRRLGRLVEVAGTRPVTFHRAFDLLSNPDEALERVIDFGIRRVLTSGGSDRAAVAGRLGEYRRRADARLEILAAGGIRSSNVVDLIRESGVDQIHLGPFVRRPDPWSRGHSNTAMAEHLALDADEVRRVVELVKTPP